MINNASNALKSCSYKESVQYTLEMNLYLLFAHYTSQTCGTNASYDCLATSWKLLQLYHVLYSNLYAMCLINSMTLTHYVTAGIDCIGGTCFVCSWSGVAI